MIKVRGWRPAIVCVKGKFKEIKDYATFNLWNISEAKCLFSIPSKDRPAKYIELVTNYSSSLPKFKQDELDYDCMTCDTLDVVGSTDLTSNHIEQFKMWLHYCEEQDYTIEFYEELI
jgi:hypothetical protein